MMLDVSNPSFVISQASMFIATALVFISYQFREGKIFRWLFVVAGALSALHFILLGAITASIIVAINSLRWLVSIFSKERAFLYSFVVLMIGILFFTYENIFSFLPAMAGVIATFAIFHKDELQTRIILLIVGLMWLSYNFIIFSPVGIISEILFFSSGIIGYVRLRASQREETR